MAEAIHVKNISLIAQCSENVSYELHLFSIFSPLSKLRHKLSLNIVLEDILSPQFLREFNRHKIQESATVNCCMVRIL